MVNRTRCNITLHMHCLSCECHKYEYYVLVEHLKKLLAEFYVGFITCKQRAVKSGPSVPVRSETWNVRSCLSVQHLWTASRQFSRQHIACWTPMYSSCQILSFWVYMNVYLWLISYFYTLPTLRLPQSQCKAGNTTTFLDPCPTQLFVELFGTQLRPFCWVARIS
jgi:hypothetical protein